MKLKKYIKKYQIISGGSNESHDNFKRMTKLKCHIKGF